MFHFESVRHRINLNIRDKVYIVWGETILLHIFKAIKCFIGLPLWLSRKESENGGNLGSTCSGAAKPVCHNYWVSALEPKNHTYWAFIPQLLKPMHPRTVLPNKRSPRSEKPVHRNCWVTAPATRGSPCSSKTQHSQNYIN